MSAKGMDKERSNAYLGLFLAIMTTGLLVWVVVFLFKVLTPKVHYKYVSAEVLGKNKEPRNILTAEKNTVFFELGGETRELSVSAAEYSTTEKGDRICLAGEKHGQSEVRRFEIAGNELCEN